MNTRSLLERSNKSHAVLCFIICIAVLIGSVVLAHFFQKNFGRIDVSNIYIKNYNGLRIRAKLLKPSDIPQGSKLPGILYVHGYQSNREVSDPYCIELARRSFVVVNIDAIGRGNSDTQMDMTDPNFDPGFGTKSSFEYLKSIPYVDKNSVGLMGHSLGAEMVYNFALDDPSVKALIITGYGYTKDKRAGPSNPKNMLMIFGKYDEFRDRMTGTVDFKKEWMKTEQTKIHFPVSDPKLETTYGSFKNGTARRVVVPDVIHIMETQSRKGIAEALSWMKQALNSDEKYWIDPYEQVWPYKEWFSLLAMIACFVSLGVLGLILLRTPFFNSLAINVAGNYNYINKGKKYFKYGIINTILIWVYIPSIFLIFGIHKYIVPIDTAFPLMIVNAIIFWFLLSNAIGFLIFKHWFNKQHRQNDLTFYELGISYDKNKMSLNKILVLKTLLLGIMIFLFAYICEHLLEYFFIIDFTFIFSFVSDLTPYRALLFFEYAALLFFGFIFNGIFLHAQMRRPKKDKWYKTYISQTLFNLILMIGPFILLLLIQYIPLFAADSIPFVGPGGVLVTFFLNIFHIIVVLLIILPLSTWFYQLTGKIYLGALVNTLIVAWMFTSSQVIAPIPV